MELWLYQRPLNELSTNNFLSTYLLYLSIDLPTYPPIYLFIEDRRFYTLLGKLWLFLLPFVFRHSVLSPTSLTGQDSPSDLSSHIPSLCYLNFISRAVSLSTLSRRLSFTVGFWYRIENLFPVLLYEYIPFCNNLKRQSIY